MNILPPIIEKHKDEEPEDDITVGGGEKNYTSSNSLTEEERWIKRWVILDGKFIYIMKLYTINDKVICLIR